MPFTKSKCRRVLNLKTPRFMCLPSIVQSKGSKSEVNATRMSEKEAVKKKKKKKKKQRDQSENLHLKLSYPSKVQISNVVSSLMPFAIAKSILGQVPGLGHRACLLDWRTQDLRLVLRTQTLGGWEDTLLGHFVTRRWSYPIVFRRRGNRVG
jgi:hypothetical protein